MTEFSQTIMLCPTGSCAHRGTHATSRISLGVCIAAISPCVEADHGKSSCDPVDRGKPRCMSLFVLFGVCQGTVQGMVQFTEPRRRRKHSLASIFPSLPLLSCNHPLPHPVYRSHHVALIRSRGSIGLDLSDSHPLSCQGWRSEHGRPGGRGSPWRVDG